MPAKLSVGDWFEMHRPHTIIHLTSSAGDVTSFVKFSRHISFLYFILSVTFLAKLQMKKALHFIQTQTTRETLLYVSYIHMTLTVTHDLDLHIQQMYLHTKIKFLGPGFQRLESEQDRQTDRHTDAAEHT